MLPRAPPSHPEYAGPPASHSRSLPDRSPRNHRHKRTTAVNDERQQVKLEIKPVLLRILHGRFIADQRKDQNRSASCNLYYTCSLCIIYRVFIERIKEKDNPSVEIRKRKQAGRKNSENRINPNLPSKLRNRINHETEKNCHMECRSKKD